MYRRAVPVVARAARMVGTSTGVAIGWHDGDKLQFARVTGDGQLGEVSTWGKRVAQLCEGTASNEHQWGVAWLQKDGRVWVLHGPTRRREPRAKDREVDQMDQEVTAELASTTWCGVTSAGKHLVLLWRDTANRTFMNQCDDKRCESAVVRVPIAAKQQLAGIACVERMCLVAVRDERGGASLAWITTLRGKVVWVKPLPDATAATTFSITAAGDQAFVVGYVTREGATATRVIESGSMVRAWADPYSSEPPVVAWANDRLLVAHRHGDNVAPEIVPLPR